MKKRPPRIQARIDACRPLIDWMVDDVKLADPIEPITTSWSFIDFLRVTIKPSIDNDTLVTACFVVKAGEYGTYANSYEATGLSSFEAALKCIKLRIEAEGKDWIDEIVKRESSELPTR